MPLADILRLIAVVLSVSAGAAILSVIRLHWRAWRAARVHTEPLLPKLYQQWRTWPALRRQQGTLNATKTVARLNWLAVLEAGDSPGLTPFHVWGVATAHALLLAGITSAMIDQLGEDGPAIWRIPFYIVAPTITLIALWAIGLRQRRLSKLGIDQRQACPARTKEA
jgi:hypothetical protein